MNMLWAQGVIPYTISMELGKPSERGGVQSPPIPTLTPPPPPAHRQSEIKEAFSMITSATCIRFQERTYEANYLDIKDGDG